MTKTQTTHFAHGTWSLCNHGNNPIICTEIESEVTCKLCLRALGKRQ